MIESVWVVIAAAVGAFGWFMAIILVLSVWRTAREHEEARTDAKKSYEEQRRLARGGIHVVEAFVHCGLLRYDDSEKWLNLSVYLAEWGGDRCNEAESVIWRARTEWLKKQAAAKPVKKAGAR